MVRILAKYHLSLPLRKPLSGFEMWNPLNKTDNVFCMSVYM